MDNFRKAITFLATAASVCAVVVLLYSPGLHGPFVFDDLANILLAPRLHISELTWASLKNAAFWQEDTGLGRPLAMASFALNYYFGEFNPFFFKATNLAIHLLNGLLIYLLASQLLQQHGEHSGTRQPTPHVRSISLLVSFAWLIHPLNLTSVLYIVQRMTSLSALFTLLGLVAFVIGRKKILESAGYGFVLVAIAPLACAVLAVLAKENGVLLPLYMLVIEIFFFRFAAPPQFARGLKAYWSTLAILPLIAAITLLFLKPDYVSRIFSYEHRDFSLAERLLTETRVLWFYLRLVLLPSNSEMGIYHDDFVPSRALFEPYSTAGALVGILGLAGIAAMAFRRAPILGFGISWFLAGHLLESTVLPLELVHEHRNYLPQVGIILAIGYYVARFAARFPQSRKAQQAFLILYVVLLGSVTYARAEYWKDEVSLHTHHAFNHPDSARSHTALAILLHENRQYEQASYHFTRAAELVPREATTWIRLAHHSYLASKAVPEPILQQLESCLATCPYSNVTLWTFEPLLKATEKDAVLNLRLIRMYQGLAERDDSNVGKSWRQVTYRTLGFALREQKRYQESITYFEKAAMLQPLPIYDLLQAEIYFRAGNAAKSREKLEQAGENFSALNEEEQQRWHRLKADLAGAGGKARKASSS